MINASFQTFPKPGNVVTLRGHTPLVALGIRVIAAVIEVVVGLHVDLVLHQVGGVLLVVFRGILSVSILPGC